VVAARARREHPDAAASRAGRGPSRRGRPVERPGAGIIDDLPTVADLIARIMNEAEQTFKRLGDLT